MSVHRFPIAAALLIAGLAACSEADDPASEFRADGGPFGDDIESMDAGAEPGPTDGSGSEDGSPEDEVQLRVVQGVLNLRASYLCHAPDFDLEDADAGFESAVELPLALPDGGLEFGARTAYAGVRGISGAITVHRLPNLDAGLADAAAADAGPADGGGADAGASPAAPPRCDRASLEAVLPLPMPATWVDPPRSEMDAGAPAEGGARPEAGPSLEARGLVSSVSGGEALTLFGSGFLLDREELNRRVEQERQRYESEHADDPQGAQDAADRYRRLLDVTYGPRFLLSRAQPAERPLSFSLQFAHLISDVPGPPDAGSGALQLCITVDAMESSELGDAGAAAVFDFRSNRLLGDDYNPDAAYRFRAFVQSAYAQEQKTCATTSLKPVGELVVLPGAFEAGRSYSLVALGAMAPEKICTSMQGSLIRPGCAPALESAQARLELIRN